MAEQYRKANVISDKHINDTLHIAIVNHINALISWNFKHMVNLDRIKGYHSVNLRTGCGMIDISPLNPQE